MFELEHIGKSVLLKNRKFKTYYSGIVVDVKDKGYVVEMEERARLLIGNESFVDLEVEKKDWQLWERMF